mmetsp:Transcript_25559/g.66860  ORF Transcript_25559/g.66860 Transcript_25559/m.66860 type:complete len:261 (+) Transcript_25559:1216-1998(+)
MQTVILCSPLQVCCAFLKMFECCALIGSVPFAIFARILESAGLMKWFFTCFWRKHIFLDLHVESGICPNLPCSQSVFGSMETFPLERLIRLWRELPRMHPQNFVSLCACRLVLMAINNILGRGSTLCRFLNRILDIWCDILRWVVRRIHLSAWQGSLRMSIICRTVTCLNGCFFSGNVSWTQCAWLISNSDVFSCQRDIIRLVLSNWHTRGPCVGQLPFASTQGTPLLLFWVPHVRLFFVLNATRLNRFHRRHGTARCCM